MKVGDLVSLYSSRRRNGNCAGKMAVIVGFEHGLINVMVDGRLRTGLHSTQVYEVISGSR